MKHDLTRRSFLRCSAQSASGLWLASSFKETILWGVEAGSASFEPSVFLRISSNNQITFYVTRSEMGQGIRTVLPMVVAEELNVDPSVLVLRQASTTPEFAKVRLRTSGSSSSTGTWRAMRRAGATAREMLRSAAAERWQVAVDECVAEDGTILHRLSGRSLSYGSLAAAAAKLPLPQDVPLKTAKDFRVVGIRRKRTDGPEIVTGKASYGLDFKLPGMRYAVMLRSPVFGENPIKWDASRALQLPGVREVAPVLSGLAAGIAVTADDTWTAIKARDLIHVEWAAGPNRSFSSEGFYMQLRSGLQREGYLSRVEGSFSEHESAAAETLEAVYEWPYQAHCPLEPMNCTAHVKSDSCEIWVPTQAPEEAQERSAKLLGVPVSSVTVHVSILGGGFGRRLFTDYVVEAVELSKAIGHPVQLVWTREDDFKFGYFNPPNFNRLIAAFGPDNQLTGWFHRVASSDLSIYPHTSTDPMRYAKDGDPWGAYDNPYSFPSMLVDYVPVESPVPTGPWRSVDYPGAVFARECFVDEIARHLGTDPIEFRLTLLQHGQELVLGEQKIERGRLAGVLELARAKSGWGSKPKKLAGRSFGRGLACNVYDAETYMAQVAEVSVGPQGDVKVHRIVCAVDLGQPINPLGIEGQVESGIIWGLTSTLKSTMKFKNGAAQGSTFGDYELLRMDETPEIETHIVASNLAPCGLGEQPVPLVAPAVANAIFAATTKRVRRLPITPADLS